jgi:D-tagatose-1,6-bisphosphate aldolase subunit GatZ/KbaZ
MRGTLGTFERAFSERRLMSAWKRVVAIVVQPGVEFGSDLIFDYDRSKTQSLSAALVGNDGIVYEAHSTDYQSPKSLKQMVEDHLAILKVGPWLTFAYREAVLALAAIEHELFKTNSSVQQSQVRKALEQSMLSNPVHWQSYYRGDEQEIRRELIYSYSDRCRYYWNEPSVQNEVAKLFDNLAAQPIPDTLLSQYLPFEYEAIREGALEATWEMIVRDHIQRVLRVYSRACGSSKRDVE